MKLKSFLFASVAAMVSVSAANAQDYEGLYGAIGAGFSSVLDDRDFEVTQGAPGFQVDSDIDYNNGVGIYSALGYAYGNGWRTEGEFSYRNNNVEDVANDGFGFSGFPEGSISGDLKSYSLLGNLIYDFTEAKALGAPITPYVGGGVGFTVLDLSLAGSNPVAQQGITPLSINDSRVAIAVQGIAGFAVDIAENVVLDVSYRYFTARKDGFDAQLAGIGTDIRTSPESHNLFAGLRWNFGAPVAAPTAPTPTVQYKDCWDGSSVPVSAACPPELVEEAPEVPDPIQVTVYFDYDKSNLTPQASSLIREAVSRSREFDVDGVRVVGNTDSSGSSAYNQALSERRARVVRDALIAQGVPAGIISTQSLGESNLAKPTPDGTREPLNRRTEITILFE